MLHLFTVVLIVQNTHYSQKQNPAWTRFPVSCQVSCTYYIPVRKRSSYEFFVPVYVSYGASDNRVTT